MFLHKIITPCHSFYVDENEILYTFLCTRICVSCMNYILSYVCMHLGLKIPSNQPPASCKQSHMGETVNQTFYKIYIFDVIFFGGKKINRSTSCLKQSVMSTEMLQFQK